MLLVIRANPLWIEKVLNFSMVNILKVLLKYKNMNIINFNYKFYPLPVYYLIVYLVKCRNIIISEFKV